MRPGSLLRKLNGTIEGRHNNSFDRTRVSKSVIENLNLSALIARRSIRALGRSILGKKVMIDPQKFIELEYQQLRAEILKRIELRHQVIQTTLTFAGILIGVGAQTGNPLLSSLYPPLALCFAMLWAQNDIRGRQLGQFIREEIEKEAGRWESFYRDKLAAETLLGRYPLSVFAPSAFCIFNISGRSNKWWLLIVLDFVALGGTIFLLRKVLRTREMIMKKKPAT
jgi:hypothetical protein